MPFRRFLDPAYDLGVGGSFPGTVFGEAYDRINVVSGGTGAGGSALVAGPKGSGPNAGTLLVAFGEDGLSAHVNRGMKVLSENTDHLDDVVHRDLVEPTLSGTIVSTGDTDTDLDGSTPAEIWVGGSGSAIGQVFQVVDTSLQPLFDPVTGARIIVSSITGASLGSGFTSANPLTLNFNVTIPSAVSYRIIYGRRSNVAVQPDDQESKLGILGAPNGRDYLATILYGGLNARYRNATSSAAAKLDQAGAGAVVSMDGPGVEYRTPTTLLSDYRDPVHASSIVSGVLRGGVAVDPLRSMGSGRVSYLGMVMSTDPDEDSPELSVASRMTLWAHDYLGDITSPATALTQVTPSRAAVANPTGGPSANTIELNASDFFQRNTGTLDESSVATGYDLLEITRASGDVETYYINELAVSPETNFARRCKVKTLAGDIPSFTSDEAVNCRWITMLEADFNPLVLWNQDQNTIAQEQVRHGAPIFRVPPALTSNDLNEILGLGEIAPKFIARGVSTGIGAIQRAMEWGYDDLEVDSNGVAGPKVTARMLGDGTLLADGLIHAAVLAKKAGLRASLDASTSPSITWDVKNPVKPEVLGSGVYGSFLELDFTLGNGTLTLTMGTTYSPLPGHMLELVVNWNGTGPPTPVIAWPSDFKFSGSDDLLPAGAFRVKYTFTYTHNSEWLATRTDYAF